MSDAGAIQITTTRTPGKVVLDIAGEISTHESTALRAAIKAGLEGKPALLIVDLSGVTFMATAGVATLVEGLQGANKSSTRFVLCGMQDRVRAVFEISRLTRVFIIVDTAQQA